MNFPQMTLELVNTIGLPCAIVHEARHLIVVVHCDDMSQHITATAKGWGVAF
jgi:hypothetical protein